VASGIIGVADTFSYKPQLKKEFKIKLMDSIKTKSKAVGDRENKHEENKNGKYLVLAIIMVGLGIGAYFYIKNRKKIAAEGLQVGGGEPSVQIPVVEPSPVIQSVVEPVVAPQPITPIAQPIPSVDANVVVSNIETPQI